MEKERNEEEEEEEDCLCAVCQLGRKTYAPVVLLRFASFIFLPHFFFLFLYFFAGQKETWPGANIKKRESNQSQRSQPKKEQLRLCVCVIVTVDNTPHAHTQ